MSTLLLVAVVAALVGVGLALMPLTLRFSLQARGEPNGFWALGGGVQLGPLAGSGVAAKGVPAQLALHAFGKKLWGRKLAELGAERPEPGEPAEPPAKTKLRERYSKLERWFDPVDLFFFLVSERRRIELLPTIVDLEYGFRDIATTGKLLGAIYAIAPLLPAPLRVRQSPAWESLDRAALTSSGAIRVWPGLLVVDAAWYLIRNVKVRRPNGAAGGTREAT